MTPFDLNIKELDERLAIISDHGTFLAARCADGHTFVLYHLEGFFAEVCFAPGHWKVTMARGFLHKEYLDPYLALIDISGTVRT